MLKSIVSVAAKVVLARFLNKGLDKVEECFEPTAVEQTISQAYEEWITAILGSLRMQGYEEQELEEFFQAYHFDLASFLKDQEAAEELLKPFSSGTTKVSIDHNRLLQRWEALGLRPLPEDVDTAAVSRAYLRRINKAGIINPDFRELFLAQLARESAEHLEAIRSFWPEFDLEQYAKRMKQRYSALDLSALTPPERDDVEAKPVLLRDVFVPQNARQSRPPRELPKELWRKMRETGEVGEESLPEELREEELQRLQDAWLQAKSESVLAVLANKNNNHLVLLGDPGSGKSALARYLLLSVIEPPLGADGQPVTWMDTFTGHLPLLVELRNYMGVKAKKTDCHNFVEYFHYLGVAEGYNLNHLNLKEHLKTHPSLVIFDGLDEIFESARRAEITKEIIGFADYYPLARVLVTSRIIGYLGKLFINADFQEYTLLELDRQQIWTFAHGWFELVFSNKPGETEFRQQRILEAIHHSSAIRQLAGNPMLLTMIAIIAKNQELPRERAKLYEHTSKVLCHHWDMTGKHISEAKMLADFMREDDKLELLRRIAKRMQSGSKGLAGNFILAADLQEEIEGYLEFRWKLKPKKARRIGMTMIVQLRERNFILCLWGANVYGFVHRTFLEYFCATEIVDRFTAKRKLSIEELKKGTFLAHYQDNAWHEVLRLICGLLVPYFAGKLIDAIVPGKKESFEKTDTLILAIQCLSEVRNLNEIEMTAKRVLEGIFGWFEQQNKYKSGDPVKKEQVFLDNAVPAIENIGATWPVRKTIVDWLPDPKKETHSINGAYAFGRIVKALCPDDKKIKQTLITLSGTIARKVDSYMAFDALARGFGKQEDVYLLLHQRAIKNEHEDIRTAALRALAEHCAGRDETYMLLSQRAVEDGNWYVRSTVLGVLAKYFDRPDTHSLLRKQTIDDEHENVRSAALRNIIDYYIDDPGTYSLLHQCASEDKHEKVRSIAIGGLMQYHNDDRWQILLSRDADKHGHWLGAINKEHAAKVAEKLNKSQAEIYREYETIARKIPLLLEWREA